VNELTAQKNNHEKKIKEILKEFQKLTTEIKQKEDIRSGKSVTDKENSIKQVDKEREQVLKLTHANGVAADNGQKILQVILAEEEKKAKDLLDLKITADQDLEVLVEKADKLAKDRKDLRQELIEKKLKLSMLESAKKQLDAEEKELAKTNPELLKENEKYEKDNEQLRIQIMTLIQHIDVSSLLKQIDLEEMKMLAKNNDTLSGHFMGVINAWESIIKNS
jgi:chromosome segregation ATPase